MPIAKVPVAIPEQTAQEKINGRLYRRADLFRHYDKIALTPPEAAAMIRYRDDIVRRRVLDLGCGAGRLATYLLPHVRDYVGFDISPHMLNECRRKFPACEFMMGDMRDLRSFPDESFDAVFAICNLFGAVGHEDRLRTLGEVRRVLIPGGLLVFSAHNRNYANLAARPRMQASRNPVTQIRHVFDYIRARSNCRRIRPSQRFEADFALVNDSGHNYAVLHYYITRQAQAKQLAETGFSLLECLDESGCTLGVENDDSLFASIHYLARKNPQA